MTPKSRPIIMNAVRPEGNIPQESKDLISLRLRYLAAKNAPRMNGERLLDASSLRSTHIWPTPSLAVIEAKSAI